MQRALLLLVVVAFIPRTAAAQGGDPLGPEFRVNTYTTGNQTYASIASDSAGNFVVVWTGDDGLSGSVFGQRYASSGGPLGPEFRVNTYTTNLQSDPAVGSDASGNFVVAWRSDQGVYGQRYASTGTPLGPEFRVNTYTTGGQFLPAVASDASGNFVVVWSSGVPSYAVFAQRYASSGAPLGPEFRVNTYTTVGFAYPSIASDSAGNFVVVWMNDTQDGSSFGVFGQRYSNSGSPLGPEFRVNTYTTYGQSFPSVAVDIAGNFVVVWQSLGQDAFAGYGVFGQRYANSGSPLGPEFRVNTYTMGTQARPAVTSDATGNFVVVWQDQSQDGSADGVFGQRYASTGTPLGPEFRVNTYTTVSQSRPSVAADSVGKFVVVWNSSTQDGSFEGLFGQRYSEIVPVELMHFRVE
jgi:hypothetical protein